MANKNKRWAGNTALHMAAKEGHLNCCRVLVQVLFGGLGLMV